MLYDRRVQRLATVALALLAALVLAAAGYVIAHGDDVPSGARTAATTRAASAGAGPTSARPSGAPASTNAGPAVVAFLGDDWTSGVAASSTSKRFTARLAEGLGVRERNFGADHSGYAAGSGGNAEYAARVDDVVAAKPDVVVVSGGRNDVLQDEAARAADNARTLFATLHRRLPHASLVAVAPMWGDSEPPGELATLATAVRKAVTAAGGRYVDLPDPIRGRSEDMATDADPNDKGYAAVAAALEPKLRPLLPG